MPANNVIELILRFKNQLSGPLAQASAAVRTFAGGVNRATTGAVGGFRTLGTQIQATNKQLIHMHTLLKGAVLVGLGRGLISAADAMLLVNTRLKLVTTSTEQLNQVQKDLFKLAQDTRSGFSETVDLYARVARSTRQLGASQSDLIKFTKAVSESIQVSGSTSREAAAGVIQFGQALASSRLSGDEIRSVLEQMPRLAKALADGLGVSIGKLREMGQAGELTAPKVFQALLSQSDKINEEFQSVNVTVAGAATNIKNSLVNMVGSVLNGTGATGDLIESMQNLSKELDKPETAAAFANLVQMLSDVAGVAVKAAIKLGEFYKIAGEGSKVIAEALARAGYGADTPEQRNLDQINELLERRTDLMKSIAAAEKGEGGSWNANNIKRWRAELELVMKDLARLNAANLQFDRDRDAAGVGRGTVPGADKPSVLPPSFNRGAVDQALEASFFGSEKTAEKIRENVKALQEFRTAFKNATDEQFTAAGTTRKEYDDAGKALARMNVELLRLSVTEIFKDGAAAVNGATDEVSKQRIEVNKQIQALTAYITKLRTLSAEQIAHFQKTGELTAGGLAEAERALARVQAVQSQLKLGDHFEDARSSIKSFVGDLEQQRFELARGATQLRTYITGLMALSEAERAALVKEEIIDPDEINRATVALAKMQKQLAELPVSTAAAKALDVFKALRNEIQVIADEVAAQQIALTDYLKELMTNPEANAEAIRIVLEAQHEAALQGEENIRRARIGLESLEATAKAAAETIQQAFAGAVRSIIELDTPREILRNFLKAILEIPIQVAAAGIGAKVREALHLDEWFKNLFGAKTAGAPAGAAQSVVTAAVGAVVPGAAGAAGQTGTTVTNAAVAQVQSPTTQIAQVTGQIASMNVQAANVQLTAQLMQGTINRIIASVQQCVSSCATCSGADAGSDGGGLLGAVIGAAVGGFAGGGGAAGSGVAYNRIAAGGGLLSPGKLSGLGEDEAVIPASMSRVFNRRQIAFMAAGAGERGAIVNAPTYNITVDSRADRSAVRQDMVAILQEHNREQAREMLSQASRGRRA